MEEKESIGELRVSMCKWEAQGQCGIATDNGMLGIYEDLLYTFEFMLHLQLNNKGPPELLRALYG